MHKRFVEVALWGEIAQNVDTNRLTHGEFPCIVAVTSMKVTQYNQIQLESTSATHVYINPDNEDARLLAESMRLTYGDAPINNQNMQTIDELMQKSPATNAERLFTCRASVTGFARGKPWFYKGCVTCNRKLSQKGDELVCGDHSDETQPKYIYCVNAIITDNTGSTTVTMFDSPVHSMIPTCSTMVIQEGYADPDKYPHRCRQCGEVLNHSSLSSTTRSFQVLQFSG